MPSKFKIGQRVICHVNKNLLSPDLLRDWERLFRDPDNERLIPNVDYIIEDIDFHFPGKICVKLKGPYYFHSEFVPDVYFTDDISFMRDEKIDQILK